MADWLLLCARLLPVSEVSSLKLLDVVVLYCSVDVLVGADEESDEMPGQQLSLCQLNAHKN